MSKYSETIEREITEAIRRIVNEHQDAFWICADVEFHPERNTERAQKVRVEHCRCPVVFGRPE